MVMLPKFNIFIFLLFISHVNLYGDPEDSDTETRYWVAGKTESACNLSIQPRFSFDGYKKFVIGFVKFHPGSINKITGVTSIDKRDILFFTQIGWFLDEERQTVENVRLVSESKMYKLQAYPKSKGKRSDSYYLPRKLSQKILSSFYLEDATITYNFRLNATKEFSFKLEAKDFQRAAKMFFACIDSKYNE